MKAAPVAYLCADPGIPPDSSKGASVHFRAMARALAQNGQALDVLMTRAGAVDGFLPHRARVVATPRAVGVAGEVLQLAHSQAVFEALDAAGPHVALYERLALFSAGGLAYARARSIPYVVEVNAPLWLEAAEFRSLHLAATAQALCLDVLRSADAVFAVSKALAALLVDAGAPSARVHVLGNGADLASFQDAPPCARPAALRGKPVLLFAGSLKPWHGVDFLLEAFAALRRRRPCGLWIVGDGPMKDAVVRAQHEMPADVVWEGAVPHERMPELLAAADAICAPYPGSAPAYFSPLKVVEGLAARRPLIGSRVPCVLGELDGRELPGLYEADSVPSFVAAAERVLADPAAARADEALVAALDWTSKARVVLPWLRGTAVTPEAARGG